MKANEMRDLINLVEAQQQATSQSADLWNAVPQSMQRVITADVIGKVLAKLTRGHEPGQIQNVEGRDTATAAQLIIEALRQISRVVHLGDVTAFRGMTVPVEWVDNLRESGQHLGLHWTLDADLVMSDLGYGNDDNEESEYRYIVMTAIVPLTSIDWVTTLPEIIDGIEQEVVMLPNMPLMLEHVENGPDDFAADQFS